MNTRSVHSIGSLVVAVIFLLANCQSNKPVQTFSLEDSAPLVIDHKGREIFQYWEFENDPLFFRVDPGAIPALESYRDSLERELGKDSFQHAIQKEASQSNHQDTLNSGNGDLMNAQLVHSGQVGKIRPINFLEAELLNYQLNRYPLLSHPTEFHGFILVHDSLNRIRAYFAASDQPWPPKPTVILKSIEKDLKQGWSLQYHLHNHYEPKSNNYVGILAPSVADAQFFAFLWEDFNLDKALITNGFHTLEIENKEFSKFRTP